MNDLFRLDGTVALITGASSGLGRHFAKTLAGAGASVAVTARRMAELESLAEEIGEAGGRATAISLDVTDSKSVGAAFDATENALGSVTLLVNNAGIGVTRPSLDLTEEEWDQVVDTNLKGAWLTAQEAARRMIRANLGGRIVNVASILGIEPVSQVIGYAASKAALIQLTRALARELGPQEILVNALAPGYVETDLNRAFLASDAGRKMINRFPQRRLAVLEDLDGALLLLASPAGRFITGTVLVVDGGQSLIV